MQQIAILGTGMAAFGAVHQLSSAGIASTCYDRTAYLGGHSATFADPSGFLFDGGPHVSFTQDERVQELFASFVRGCFQTVELRVDNVWQGHRITHPAQCNLHGLPPDMVTRIVADFVAEQAGPARVVRTYADWLYASYGRTFAEMFPIVYGAKYHTTTADNMTTDWLGPRMYRPSLQELVRGALAPPTTNVHYKTHARYPTAGGFVSYLQPLAERSDVRLGHEVVHVEPRRRELRFANGVVASYDRLISSIPLPDLVPMVAGAPADVIEAAGRLAYSTAVIVNVGVDRPDLSDAHLTYFYDPDIVFARLSFPHMLSPNNAPPGAGSIQAEIYSSEKYRPLTVVPEALIDDVLRDCRRVGILEAADRVLFREARVVRFANVIHDLERADALAAVHGYLDDVGVLYCGRYGDWDHAWTDEAFVSGERAAERALEAAAA